MHERLSGKKDLGKMKLFLRTLFSMKISSRVKKVIEHKYVKYTCSMETVQQNGRFTPF